MKIWRDKPWRNVLPVMLISLDLLMSIRVFEAPPKAGD
jgi:hypothetical protein